MSEIDDINLLKNRAIKGILALTSRTFLLQIVSLGATFLLTVFLQPAEYGVFFVVSAIVNFLVYFSDIGLAAALIQKPENINEEDLKTTFTIQQLLVFSIMALVFIFSSKIAIFYNFSYQGLWLFRALVISFFLSSFKTIPSIILERGLYFDKLIIPSIVETLLFYLVAVFLAWQGYGITSFTFAVLIRSFSGLLIIYLLAPWRPSLGIVKKSAQKLLSFGVPFQLNSLLALIKDDLLTAFLGKILTFSQIGYIGWAQKWAYFPLRFFMDSINRVTFPAYARIQHHQEILRKAIEKSLYFISFFVFPILVGLFLTAPYFINFFPKYQKWQPATFSLTLFCINALFASITTTLTNTLNATGKIKITLKLMFFWTSLTWILTLILIKIFGFNGVSLASALVAVTSWVTIWLTQKVIAFSFFKNIKDAMISTLIMAFAFYLTAPLFIDSLTKLFIFILACSLLYLFIFLLIGRKKFFIEIKMISFKKI